MQVTVTTRPQEIAIALQGQFTFAAHGAFRDVLANRIDQPGTEAVVIDLGQLDYIDSSALGMLLLARDTAGRHKRRIALRGARDQVARVLAMARFDTLFPPQA